MRTVELPDVLPGVENFREVFPRTIICRRHDTKPTTDVEVAVTLKNYATFKRNNFPSGYGITWNVAKGAGVDVGSSVFRTLFTLRQIPDPMASHGERYMWFRARCLEHYEQMQEAKKKLWDEFTLSSHPTNKVCEVLVHDSMYRFWGS